ncbi:MAG TPA: PhaM family polyhydroxyalkanoate granule multifunctional regulatory protein [Janthinobacterium sp.]|jgi:hypothetical protein|nr:PhaM family polyhydroxyalkanoate granule multifunctional regulatory protein [Janthinobacterium sp.]
MAKPQVPNNPGAAVMTDTLDFVKNLWGSMSVPGMGIPGITAPTLSVEDLDKKIGDLKAVEAWLNVNMSMLRATIQGMEVQRGTLVTLKSLGASFAAAVKQPENAEKSLWESPYASAFFHQATTPSAPLKAPPEPEQMSKSQQIPKPAPAAPAATAAQMTNPVVWWNMLQEQFKQAVSTAMSPEAVASATAMASEAAAQFAAAAGAGSSGETQAGEGGVKENGDKQQAKPKTAKADKN